MVDRLIKLIETIESTQMFQQFLTALIVFGYLVAVFTGMDEIRLVGLKEIVMIVITFWFATNRTDKILQSAKQIVTNGNSGVKQNT